jgi:hypothetical protein
MKYRTFAFATAVAAASIGLLPVTAMAASAHVATTPPPTVTGTGTGTAGSGSNSGASANNQNTINLKVYNQLPKDVHWGDSSGRPVLINNNNGNVLQAPSDYVYRDGGLYSNDGHFYIDPAGAHASIVSETQRCNPRIPSGIGGVLDFALKACGVAYKWAYDTIAGAAGAEKYNNGPSSYC